jgi:hypothetical protein
MATYIKAVGCECEDCTPDDPCASGCDCSIFEVDFLDGAVEKNDDYDVTGEFVFAQNLTVDVEFGATGSGMRFQVLANGVSIYDSGCQTGWVDVAIVSVPAGTVTLTVQFTNCGGATNSEGSFLLQC